MMIIATIGKGDNQYSISPDRHIQGVEGRGKSIEEAKADFKRSVANCPECGNDTRIIFIRDRKTTQVPL